MAKRHCFLCYIFKYSWLSVHIRIRFFGCIADTHTFTKSWSCSSTYTVLRRVGYHVVSCLSNEGTWKIWLTLSFSLISVPVTSLFAFKNKIKRYFIFMFPILDMKKKTH